MKPECNESKFPLYLLAAFVLESVWLGIAPADRTVWFAESMTAWVPLAALIILYMCKVRFSNTAYACMALWFFLHTIGGHYTFEKVPFDWITNLFGFERNHYDRVCHFLVGSFAFPLIEYWETRGLVKGRALVVFFGIMTIFGVAAIFELVEWLYAECANPEAGAAFLGSQGDIWDAQKDILSDGLGAMTFSALYCILRRRR